MQNTIIGRKAVFEAFDGIHRRHGSTHWLECLAIDFGMKNLCWERMSCDRVIFACSFDHDIIASGYIEKNLGSVPNGKARRKCCALSRQFIFFCRNRPQG